MPETSRDPTFLEFFPISIFGAIMGLTGLSFSWEWAEKTWGVTSYIRNSIEVLTLLSFVTVTFTYLLKWIKYPVLVKKEFQHPVSVSFFATFIISLLLIPGFLLRLSAPAATVLWSTGAVLMFVFSWYVFRKWLHEPQETGNAMPAWVLPIAGTLDVPLVGVRLPIPGIHQICLAFFGIGLVLSLILMTIITSRLFFQESLPEPLQPTLLVLVAPFALAFSGYESLTGLQDLTASVFFYFDLFLFLIFGSKIFLLAVCCPFRVTWWAVSFPLVALTIATFRYASHIHSVIFQCLPAGMLAISTAVILYLFIQTILRIATRRFTFQPPITKKITSIIAQSYRQQAPSEKY